MRSPTVVLCLGVLFCGALAEYKLPPLPYAPDALEPSIDKETVLIHHGTHHAGYVKGLNDAVKGLPGNFTNSNLALLLMELEELPFPPKAKTAIRNYGGGHYNHMLYWQVMTGESNLKDISKALSFQIAIQFGTVEKLKNYFLDAAGAVFGSGWAWLCVDPEYGELGVVVTANQDNPLMVGLVKPTCEPILGVDVWEHAYYLDRQAGRKEYLSAFWDLINWKVVSINYGIAEKKSMTLEGLVSKE